VAVEQDNSPNTKFFDSPVLPQILIFKPEVMFGKNHLNLINKNIIVWYWKKRVGEEWFEISI